VIGVGQSRRVVLADTMLDEFPLAELRAVMAHELGHHVNRDVPKLLLFQFGTAMLGLYAAARGGKSLLRRVGGSGDLTRVADFPLLAVAAELFGLLTLPIGNLFSRILEAQADRYAHRLSGDPLAFAAAMERLARQNLAELSPPRWAEILFASHPPMAKRIRAAREVAGA
jgi:STE24 endopeptidase